MRFNQGPVSREGAIGAKNDQPSTKARYPFTIMALIRPGCNFRSVKLMEGRDRAIRSCRRAIAPFFAFRAVVVARAAWYLLRSDDVRRALLTPACKVMINARYDLDAMNRL